MKCVFPGCGTLYVADGNWKLKYPHCMWKLPIHINGFKSPLNYPDVCPLSPVRGQAFCTLHCEMGNHLSIPTGLHDFLKFCKESDGNAVEGLYILPIENNKFSLTCKLKHVSANY